MASAEVKLVLSTTADGRARDVRFRQNQFHSIHRWIINHSAQIEAALCDDEGFSDLQAKYVLSLTLRDLRRNYEKLDLKQALQAEYSIKNGRNNESASVPEDLVYIIPERYAPFYSVLIALFASIAAGSCCLIELRDDSTRSMTVTRQCLTEALDTTAFAIVFMRPSHEILKRSLVIDQLGATQSGTGKRVLRSQPQLWTVAVVDRDTDLEVAAKNIYASRTFGKSPYAPSCILVNEFVEEAFVQLLREQVPKEHIRRNATEKSSLVETEGFKVIKVQNRADLDVRASKPTFEIPLLSTSSHEDAIDAIERHHAEPLLALYVFAAPSAAKYLTQFIRSNVSFVNNIPASLLIGPAAPTNHPMSPAARYTHAMMQIPSPKFVTLPTDEPNVQQLTSKNCKLAEMIYDQSIKPLPKTGQPKDGDSNFFAQGFVTGALLLALPVVIGTVGAITYVARKAYRYWR